jgi:tRNA (cmo5U34)-methyltransferase
LAVQKSTVEEIRARFDADVERFSNLESGQSATIDAPLVLELIAQAAAATNPGAVRALDVGCGAGNYALKLLEVLPDLQFDLLDLSQPMLERAASRVQTASGRQPRTMQADVREMKLGEGVYDIITAAATLHHLREEAEWEAVLSGLHRALRPGGSIWISDLVEHSIPAVHALMQQRYGDYLQDLKGASYRDHVFAYIAKEDTPRPLLFQIDLLRKVGFREVEVLHKNSTFAAFGAIR